MILASFLQTSRWAQFQEALGRRTFFISWEAWRALLVRYELPLGFNYLYCPRGPVAVGESGIKDQESGEEIMRGFLAESAEVAGREKSVFLRMDPPLGAPSKIPDSKFRVRALAYSVQPRHTLVTALTKPEEELLAAMHEKTRYNIRLAERKGVRVREGVGGHDAEIFLALLAETSARDRFRVHPLHHYRKLLEIFAAGNGEPFLRLYLADLGKDTLAGALVMFHGRTATYLHGASSSANRNAMAPYLLHRRVMQDAKTGGYAVYDWWGIGRQHSRWAGITRFKKGFGGTEIVFPSSCDIVFNPWLYRAYALAQLVRGR